MAGQTIDYARPGLNDANKWTIGTLRYTGFGLLSLFFWMLWGDLCVNIMETVIPRLVPIQLQNLGATKWIIGLVTFSIPAGVELVINPFISTYSDRFRSRIGRRRPFILAGTPLLAACLILVGFSDGLGAGLAKLTGWSPATTTIVLLGVLLAVFQIFNVVVLATYYYLIADVVPQSVIGKFTSLYKVCGAMGGIIFNKYIFGHSEHHEKQIYIGCAAIYVVAFFLMSWRVKEGEYPAPEPLSKGGGGLEGTAQWLRESFTLRFYQKLYFIGLCYYMAVGSVPFQQFFALDDLKMSKDAFGSANAIAGLWSLPIFFIMGPIADKFHPLRTGIAGMGLMSLTHGLSYFLIQDDRSFTIWTSINTVTTTVWLGSQISLLPRVLDRSKYGQYCSANNTLCAIGKFGAPVIAGVLIGSSTSLVQSLGGNRLTYLWTAGFSVFSILAVLLVYLHWKRLGGDLNYTPPRYGAPEYQAVAPRGFEVIAPAPIADPAELTQPGADAVDGRRPGDEPRKPPSHRDQ